MAVLTIALTALSAQLSGNLRMLAELETLLNVIVVVPFLVNSSSDL